MSSVFAALDVYLTKMLVGCSRSETLLTNPGCSVC